MRTQLAAEGSLRLELRVPASTLVHSLVLRGELAHAPHCQSYALLWRPSPGFQRYGDVFQTYKGLSTLSAHGGVLVIGDASKTAADAEAAALLLLARHGLSVDARTMVERDGVPWTMIDWTDGISAIATCYVQAASGVLLELELRQELKPGERWEPMARDPQVSLLAAVEVCGLRESSGWQGDIAYQVVWPMGEGALPERQ